MILRENTVCDDNLFIYKYNIMIKTAIRLRIKPIKRRDPAQRLRARLYYRKNKAKIRMQRRRYMRIHKTQIKHRRMFMRYKPSWIKKPPKPHHLKAPHRFKVKIPKMIKPKSFFSKPHKIKHIF